jgi:hypothetical protein
MIASPFVSVALSVRGTGRTLSSRARIFLKRRRRASSATNQGHEQQGRCADSCLSKHIDRPIRHIGTPCKTSGSQSVRSIPIFFREIAAFYLLASIFVSDQRDSTLPPGRINGQKRFSHMDRDEDQKWSALAAIWQTPGDAIDVAHVQRQLRRRARNAAILFALDMAQGIIQIGLGLFFLYRGTWPSNLVGASLLLFGGFAAGLALWTRYAIDRSGLASADGAFRVSIRQAEAGIRWAISGYCVVATGVVLLCILGYAHAHPVYRSVVPLPYWEKALFAIAYLALLSWRCTRLLRENRRYLLGLHMIADDLFPPESIAVRNGAEG